MISVIISKHENEFKGFSLDGHAGFGRFGKDIVCAAVSGIVINTCNSIEKFTDDHFVCEASPDGGHILMEFHEENSKELKLLMDSMILGLENIQKQYGSKYIELHYKEV